MEGKDRNRREEDKDRKEEAKGRLRERLLEEGGRGG